jgi:hypothetical protein
MSPGRTATIGTLLDYSSSRSSLVSDALHTIQAGRALAHTSTAGTACCADILSKCGFVPLDAVLQACNTSHAAVSVMQN